MHVSTAKDLAVSTKHGNKGACVFGEIESIGHSRVAWSWVTADPSLTTTVWCKSSTACQGAILALKICGDRVRRHVSGRLNTVKWRPPLNVLSEALSAQVGWSMPKKGVSATNVGNRMKRIHTCQSISFGQNNMHKALLCLF